MNNNSNIEIYKAVKNDKEEWVVYWDDYGPFGVADFKDGFSTFYDAEHYARVMSNKTAFRSDFDNFYDEMGNVVYTKEKARYKLITPDWTSYDRQRQWYFDDCKTWSKWYMKLIKPIFKPYIKEPEIPEYTVYDLERHMTIWSGLKSDDAITFIRKRHQSESVYYYNTDMKLVSKE